MYQWEAHAPWRVRPRSSRKKNGCCLLASARTIAAEMAARWWARKVRGEDRERPYRVESWVVGARACLPSSRRARSMVGKSAPVVSVTSRAWRCTYAHNKGARGHFATHASHSSASCSSYASCSTSDSAPAGRSGRRRALQRRVPPHNGETPTRCCRTCKDLRHPSSQL